MTKDNKKSNCITIEKSSMDRCCRVYMESSDTPIKELSELAREEFNKVNK